MFEKVGQSLPIPRISHWAHLNGHSGGRFVRLRVTDQQDAQLVGQNESPVLTSVTRWLYYIIHSNNFFFDYCAERWSLTSAGAYDGSSWWLCFHWRLFLNRLACFRHLVQWNSMKRGIWEVCKQLLLVEKWWSDRISNIAIYWLKFICKKTVFQGILNIFCNLSAFKQKTDFSCR